MPERARNRLHSEHGTGTLLHLQIGGHECDAVFRSIGRSHVVVAPVLEVGAFDSSWIGSHVLIRWSSGSITRRVTGTLRRLHGDRSLGVRISSVDTLVDRRRCRRIARGVPLVVHADTEAGRVTVHVETVDIGIGGVRMPFRPELCLRSGDRVVMVVDPTDARITVGGFVVGSPGPADGTQLRFGVRSTDGRDRLTRLLDHLII